MSTIKTGSLSVRVWSISRNEYVSLDPGYPMIPEVPRASLADAIRRARHLWALIQPRGGRGGFSILIDGTDERGFHYTAFEWTPWRELPYWVQNV